jgi:phosphoserine phosphatase RsbU/P
VAAAKIENARLLEESLEKRRLEQENETAAQIQRSLLPLEAPSVAGYDVVGCNVSCRTVGGDYFDFGIEEGQLLLALGDVSGKGTPAALLMTMLRAAVRGHWADPRLSEAIRRINKTVCENVPEGKYVTFFLARLDPPSGHLNYVNAGHNPPLLVRANGSIELLTEGGMVLGLMASVPYAVGDAALRPGDTLLVFSDGVTETLDPQGEEFGDTGLTELVTHERTRSALELQARVFEALDRFAKGAKAGDDRTLIVLKRVDTAPTLDPPALG